MRQPLRRAASWSSASASMVTASAGTVATSQLSTLAVVRREHRAHPVAEPGQVVAADRAPDREGGTGARARSIHRPHLRTLRCAAPTDSASRRARRSTSHDEEVIDGGPAERIAGVRRLGEVDPDTSAADERGAAAAAARPAELVRARRLLQGGGTGEQRVDAGRGTLRFHRPHVPLGWRVVDFDPDATRGCRRTCHRSEARV